MPYLAQATIMGHAGNDTQIKAFDKDACARVNVAVETRKKIDGEWSKITTWWQVEVWGKQAEWLAKDGQKGALIVATGQPYIDTWTDKDGHQRQTLRLRATEARAVGAGKSKGEMPVEPSSPRVPSAASKADAGEDEPPF